MTKQTVMAWTAAALLAASAPAPAGRVVRESLDSVAARASRIVVAELLSVEAQDDDASLGVVVEAEPQQLLAGEALTDAAPLHCEYRENRPQKRGSAMLSPLVSGSGEEFQIRHGERVILLIAAPAASAPAPGFPPGLMPPPPAPVAADADDEAADAAPACTLLRIEPLQNRIAVLRALRHAAEARDEPRR
jgi:hypothetical protein